MRAGIGVGMGGMTTCRQIVELLDCHVRLEARGRLDVKKNVVTRKAGCATCKCRKHACVSLLLRVLRQSNGSGCANGTGATPQKLRDAYQHRLCKENGFVRSFGRD